MTSKSTWKRLERDVATALGGQRIPCSGNGQIKGDVLHPQFFIECKYREKFPSIERIIAEWFLEADWYAQNEEKIPLLALRSKGDSSVHILLKLEDFVKIVKSGGR